MNLALIKPVLWILAIDLAAWTLGTRLYRRLTGGGERNFCESVAFPVVLGLWIVSMAIFVFGLCQALYPLLLLLLILVCGGWGVVQVARRRWPLPRPPKVRYIEGGILLLLSLGVFFVVRWIVPPTMMESLEYHQQKAWFFFLFLMIGGQVVYPALLIGLVGRFGFWGTLRRFRLVSAPPPENDFKGYGPAVLIVVLAYVLHFSLHCFIPRFSFDLLAYHLMMPKRYLAHHGIVPFENLFFNMPHNMELLYTLALAGGGTVAVKLLSFQYHLLNLAGLLGFARRRLSTGMSGVLALLYIAGSNVQRHMEIAHLEPGMACFLFYAFLLLLEWIDRRRLGALLVCCAMGGWLMGCKYTVWPYAFGLFAAVLFSIFSAPGDKKTKTRRVLAACTVWPLAVIPWLVKSWIITGNPLYPALYGLWDGKWWSAFLAEQFHWRTFTYFWEGPGSMASKLGRCLTLPWQLATSHDRYGRYSAALIALFVTAPFLPATYRSRWGRCALIATLAGYLGWVMFPGDEPRYLMPLIPLMLVTIAPGLEWLKQWNKAWTAFLCILTLVCLVPIRFPRKMQLRAFTVEGYQEILNETPHNLLWLWSEVERFVPPDGKVLAVHESAVFFLNRECVYEPGPWFSVSMERLRRAGSAKAAAENLRREGFTHLVVNHKHANRYFGYSNPSKEQMDWERRVLNELLSQETIHLADYDYYSVYQLIP